MRTRRPPRAPLAVLACVLLLAGCARAGGEAFQPTHNTALALADEATLGQTFSSATGELRGVDLLVATYGRSPQPDAELVVWLIDPASGRVLAEASLAGDELDDNAWVAVRFDEPVPVPDPAAIEVGWTGEQAVALRANVPPADAGPDRLLNDPYPGGELLRDGVASTGDLTFRVVGAGGVGAAAAAAARMVRDTAAGLAQRPVFAVAWLLLLAGAVALAVWGVRAARAARSEPGEGSAAEPGAHEVAGVDQRGARPD